MIPVHRFEDQIQVYEKLPVETGKILLYGSSFFAFWGYERAKQQWLAEGKLQVVNHGFGGATVEELLYYYQRLVLPYKPAAVVLRTGHNDVWNCTAQEAYFLTEILVNWLKNDFPGIRVIALKCFDAPWASEDFAKKLWQYNALLEQLAREDSQVSLVDLNPFMYEEEKDIGTLRNFRDIFQADGLHLTDDAYGDMAKFLVPKIQKILDQ